MQINYIVSSQYDNLKTLYQFYLSYSFSC